MRTSDGCVCSGFIARFIQNAAMSLDEVLCRSVLFLNYILLRDFYKYV